MTVRTGELTVTRVRGVRVGHAESEESPTGVTALVFDRPSPTVVDVRGGASCTYDTASLSLDATFGRRWAIFFSGGSVFGLDAGRGSCTRVLEAGGGHTVFGNPTRVAPISGATLFDLPGADGPIPDYAPIGYAAAANASRGVVPMGQVGAGAGAWVGKYPRSGTGHARRYRLGRVVAPGPARPRSSSDIELGRGRPRSVEREVDRRSAGTERTDSYRPAKERGSPVPGRVRGAERTWSPWSPTSDCPGRPCSASRCKRGADWPRSWPRSTPRPTEMSRSRPARRSPRRRLLSVPVSRRRMRWGTRLRSSSSGRRSTP